MTVVLLNFEERRNKEIILLFEGLLAHAKQGRLIGSVGCVRDESGREYSYAVGVYHDPGQASQAGFRIQQGAANSDSMF